MPESLKAPCDDEVKRYGLTKRRTEVTRCDKCGGKVKVSASILLRICRNESSVLCSNCSGTGEPIERSR